MADAISPHATKAKRSMPVFSLDSLRVGDALFTAVRALSRNYNVHPGVPHIDGVFSGALPGSQTPATHLVPSFFAMQSPSNSH